MRTWINIILSICFSLSIKAQVYLLPEAQEGSSQNWKVYVVDAMGSPGIHQDDRVLDSVIIKLSGSFRFSELYFSIQNPIITGSELTYEISVFQVYEIALPQDDRLLKTIIWESNLKSISRLRPAKAKSIQLVSDSISLKPVPLKINLDSLKRIP